MLREEWDTLKEGGLGQIPFLPSITKCIIQKIREVPMALKLSKSSLVRHVKKYKNSVDKDNIVFCRDLASNMVSRTDQELLLNS